MSDERENRNTWEDVLNNTGAPPLSGSWKAMEGLLDKEMPVRPPRRGLRWLLLLLLLLLIGVCNYYRSGAPRLLPGRLAGAPGAGGGGAAVPGAVAPGAGAMSPGVGVSSSDAGVAAPGVGAGAGAAAPGAAAPGVAASTVGTPGAGPGKGPAKGKNPGGRPGAGATSESAASGGAAGGEATVGTGVTGTGAPPPSPSQGQDTAVTRLLSKVVQKQPAAKATDTTKKAAPKTKKQPEPPYKGFTVGLGFNQFFPIGPQENANFNSSGTNGTITDYLPVPEGRYYFSRKLYVEAEMQFNTPQYTSKNLLAGQQVAVNSGPFPGTTTSSVYIKKLFYFNLPLSVHYSPVKHLYLGAGLEYAKLTNGVADFQEHQSSGNAATPANDTLVYSKVGTFKGDSVYKKLRTQEWRVLADLNYQWKGFTLGLRYNLSLNKFINVQVSSTQVTQSRNSSLQLYLRYTIWRQRYPRKMKK